MSPICNLQTPSPSNEKDVYHLSRSLFNTFSPLLGTSKQPPESMFYTLIFSSYETC